MRLSHLEGWLLCMGWIPEPRKGGSTRAWTHASYPNQRLTYHAPHKADGAELRPDVVCHIYDNLTTMRPVEDACEDETRSQATQAS